jgi:hypothetical protein
MSRIRLYLDEDAMENALAIALRARRMDVLTAAECGMANRSDEEHLDYASRKGLVLYSYNMRHYSSIHSQWLGSGRQHSGIILSPQQRYSVGEQQRRLLRILSNLSATEMLSRIEYLSNWPSESG